MSGKLVEMPAGLVDGDTAMNVKTLGLAIGLSFAVLLPARAEPIFWDDLLKAYVEAGRNITAGRDRTEILNRLNQAVAQNPTSSYQNIAQKLSRDLAKSIELIEKRTKQGLKIEDAPEEFLADSKLELHLLAFPQNEKSLAQFMVKNPQDPAVLLVGKGRDCIDRLIPKLSDDSPARLYGDVFTGPQSAQTIRRVSDVALSLIEYVSHCKFHFNASTATAFHQLSDEVRGKRIAGIKEWWRENKEKSVAEGIRAQLPQAEFYEKVTMAKALIRLADKGKNPADRDFGLNVLREMLDGDIGHTAAHTAEALAEFGDHSGVDYFYKLLKDSLNVSGRYWSNDSGIVFYLTKYGGRREWELLNQIAAREVGQGLDEGRAGVWPALVNCTAAATSPYAIPGLGRAIFHTKTTGSRYINEKIGAQNFSTADNAVELLQRLTKTDFGYRVEGSANERSAAISKAQRWWMEEGEAKYTFDYIEANLVMKNEKNK